MTPATATAERERVFILAASKDQAETFTRQWMAEAPGRRLQDAIYVSSPTAVQGHMPGPEDRLVALDGHWHHPMAFGCNRALRRAAAKRRGPCFHLEHVRNL